MSNAAPDKRKKPSNASLDADVAGSLMEGVVDAALALARNASEHAASTAAAAASSAGELADGL